MSWRGWAYRRLVLRDRAKDYDAALGVISGFRPGDEVALLDRIIHHAREQVPFYREGPEYADLSAANFAAAPLLLRATVRDQAARLTSDDASPRGSRVRYTTGSTGEPLRFLVDRHAAAWQRAVDDHYLEAYLGMDPHSARRVVLWAYPNGPGEWNRRQRISQKLTHSRIVNIAHGLAPATLCGIIEEHRPRLIKGYAHSLYLLASAARNLNLRLPRVPFVVATAERLTPAMRAVIAEVFGADVRSLYATREHGPIAGECQHGRMHVFPFANRVEVVGQDRNPAEDQLSGRIVVTGLHNHAMPLLRYVLGDQTDAVRTESCACGRSTPILGPVRGRLGEQIARPDGGFVDYEMYISRLEQETWVREFTLVQNAVDDFSVIFTSKTDAPAGAAESYAELFSQLQGIPCRVALSRVDELPPVRGGKHCYVRSLVFERTMKDWHDVVS